MKNHLKLFIIASAIVVLIAPIAASAVTIEELQAQIQALLRQIKLLQEQIAQQQGGEQAWCYTFNTNLRIGDQNKEVTNLIRALVKEELLDSNEVFQDGRTILNFDETVAAAVSAFQEKYKGEILTPSGLKFATGYVGKATRAKLNKLYGCSEGKGPVPPPVIRGVKGPTALNVGEAGEWSVNASDPTSPLSYTVYWGDEIKGQGANPAQQPNPSFSQTATFSHVYQQAGEYTVSFIVANQSGLEARTSITVRVGDGGNVSLGKLYIEPSNPYIQVGQTIQLQAMYRPPMPPCTRTEGVYCAQVMPASYPVGVLWSTSRLDVVILKHDGGYGVPADKTYVTGLSAGTAEVKAVYNLPSGGVITAATKVNVVNTALPSITRITPSQGTAQSVITIYGNNLSGASNVEFYLPDGQLSGSIVPSYVSSQYLTFTISGVFVANSIYRAYQIGVVTNTCADVCRSNRVDFTLTAPVSFPSITVLSPNGGEVFVQGQSNKISWVRGSGYTQIGLMKGDIVNPDDISKLIGWINPRIDGTDGLAWDGKTVTDLAKTVTRSVPAGSYKVIAVGADAVGNYCLGCNSDLSDAPFTITAIQAALSCSDVSVSQKSYFDACRSQGFENACFNKYSGVYQGCTRNSYNDCTVNNTNAAQNLLCAVGATSQPSITVLSPNGGEAYKAGGVIPIKWSSSEQNMFVEEIVLVEERQPCGTGMGEACSRKWSLAQSVKINGYFEANIPLTVLDGRLSDYTYKYYVGVYLRNETTGSKASDSSDAPFSIAAATQPSITVLSPNGGEAYRPGETVNIRWSTSNWLESTVGISLRDVNGNYTGGFMLTREPNTGSYLWTIPAYQPSGSYKIRIGCSNCTLNTARDDDSDSPFSIVAAEIANSGLTLTPSKTAVAPGETISVSWNVPGTTTQKDWIGVAPSKGQWSSAYAWFYTNGLASGTKTIVMPASAGSYDLVYYPNNGFTELARTGPIIVAAGGAESGEGAAINAKRNSASILNNIKADVDRIQREINNLRR